MAPISAGSPLAQRSFVAKRKSLRPYRSVPQTDSETGKQKEGIFSLDVYRAFKENPQNLFSKKWSANDEVRSLPASQQSWAPLVTSNIENLQLTQEETTKISPGDQLSTIPTANSASIRVPKRRGRPPSAAARLNPSSRDLMRSNGDQNITSVYPYPSIIYDVNGKPMVTWPKQDPLLITPDYESYYELNEDELQTCSTLRITPAQYLRVKEILLIHKEAKGAFKKREAQKICRMDVNKAGKIFDWFVALGWLYSPEEMP